MSGFSKWNGIAGVLTFLFSLILLFQNCEGHRSPSSVNLSEHSDHIDQKAETIFFSRKDPVVLSNASCLLGSSYRCRVNLYAPDVHDGREQKDVCIHWEEQNICAELDEWHYDSSRALQLCHNCIESDGRPGGRYHYTEVACGFGDGEIIPQRDLEFGDGPSMGADFDDHQETDLQRAFRRAIEKCLGQLNQQ